MESAIAKALNLEAEPVALLFSAQKPEEAAQFKQGVQSCVMFMFASAARGKTAVFDRESYACPGGGIGLGFGNAYEKFPGGLPGFCRFLSTGNENDATGKAIGEGMKAAGAPATFVDHFLHGERYKRTPDLAEQFVKGLPITEVPTQYVVMKPLSKVDPTKEEPVSVTFLVNPDQLSALVIFANYDRPGLENTAVPYAAACQVMGILSYKEAQSENPRCLIGLTDISARKYLKGQGCANKLAFTVPFRRLNQMEGNVEGSFLLGSTWAGVLE
ncbi:DUF169 domain-containing protein [Oryzomonas rubra]|uniref:Uncharacterized protein n=1 Tax=Oryzomonas rubra TaxID=2509454 RepID=A0A5A9XFJ8_9BACT|nr:DUF169 domain-containing protein [Oryzomonas rubra]KAA0891786.1 hypothetical protein ET418_10145 [Oryzomonas rubra]